MPEPRSEIASRIVAKHRERQAAESTLRSAADRVLATQPAAVRQEFSNLLSGGFGSSAGAQTYRLLADWSVSLSDPNDDWRWDAGTLSARAWDLIQNDPNARALIECMVLGVLGDCGLRFRSLYQTDLNSDTTDAELAFRRSLEALVETASCDAGVDAAEVLSRRDFTAQILTSMLASGDGFAIRLWSPRKNALLAQRWRILAPERISNPDGRPNTPTLFEGIEYDAATGAPSALYVRSKHPISSENKGKPTWDKIDWRAPDGSLNVLHMFKPLRPGQRRGISWFAPLLVLAQHLSKTVEAFVVAKRTQASLPLIIKTNDVEQTALAARQNALLGPNTRWRPNLIAYTSAENDIVFPEWAFNGADYRDFIDVCLRSFSACWGLPFQFVMQQLTDANLASAQVALDQADKTFSALQDLAIAKVERPIDEAFIREGVARGLLKPGKVEPALLLASRYLRPRRPDANKQRTRDAALLFVDMGGSRSTAFAEMGYDFEEETLTRKQNDDFQKKHGVVLVAPPADAPKSPDAVAPVKAAADVRSITFLRDANGRINGLTRVESPNAL
jgi:lambda family phage portal protein